MAVRMTTSTAPVSLCPLYADFSQEKLTGVLLLLGEELANLLANLTIGDLDIVLGVAIVGHQRQEVIVGDVEL